MERGPLKEKLLYRRLDSLLGDLDPTRPQENVLESFLEDSFRTLADDLWLRGALLYGERRDGFELLRRAGLDPDEPIVELLDPQARPLDLVLRHGVYVFGNPPDAAPLQAPGILTDGAGAALVVGKRPRRHVLFFLLTAGWVMEEVDFALNTLRAALGARLTDERVKGSFREAAEIQQSLLVDEPPDFPGFEIAFRSVPSEEVSGDLYDFHAWGGELMGFAIGDASGHGLPAALLVRDVVTGLRMGIEKDLKLAHVFGKLNRVIHRSNLSSRFVSLFYGELEADGSLIYINAGHPPPLLFNHGATVELTAGGTVIGPLPEVRFRRGFARIEPGAVLVLSTDGILERRDPTGEFFGPEGLTGVVASARDAHAREIVERIFSAAASHGAGRPWEDDATVVVLRRKP